jgi:putative transposase
MRVGLRRQARCLLRSECLQQNWFLSLEDARAKLEAWHADYNEVRPHGAKGGRPPSALLPLP